MIRATLERLERLEFVDDMAFARWWVEQRDRYSPRGRTALETELRAKRVPVAIIAAMRDEAAGEEPVSEDQRADAALERHLKGRPLPEDPRALQRLGMFLVRRGFDPGTARAALRRRAANR